MPRLKIIDYNELERKLKRAGYIPVRKSKHTIYFHEKNGIIIPIPHKHTREISKGFLHKLIKEMKLSVEEFSKL